MDVFCSFLLQTIIPTAFSSHMVVPTVINSWPCSLELPRGARIFTSGWWQAEFCHDWSGRLN